MQPVSQVINSRPYRVKGNLVKTNNSIKLPDEIDSLIDNKMYRNKFKKLIRDGFTSQLLQLAEIAKEKQTPSRWFATVCSKARWESTLKWLAKARQVACKAVDIAKRLITHPSQIKLIYKALWHNPNAYRHAITAQETGKDKLKYFNWLCSRINV